MLQFIGRLNGDACEDFQNNRPNGKSGKTGGESCGQELTLRPIIGRGSPHAPRVLYPASSSVFTALMAQRTSGLLPP